MVCRLKTGVRRRAHADPAELAISALQWIGADRGRLTRFLDATGVELHALRAAASMPGFLPGLLDYILEDEWLLEAFAAHAGLQPEAVLSARDALTPHDEFGA